MPNRSHATAARRGSTAPSATWLPWALLAAVAALWVVLRLLPAAWIDGPWARSWLPPVAALTAAAIDAAPLSLTLITAAAWLAVVVAVAARRALAPRARAAWVLVLLVALGPAFELAWGLGYRRTPLEAHLGLGVAAPSAEDAWRALDRLLAAAIASAPAPSGAAAPSDAAASSGAAVALDAVALDAVALDAPWSTDALAAAAHCVAEADAFALGRDAPLRLPRRVRALPAGLLLSGGFAGFQAPWWREPHLDGGLPPVAALSTGLHELAHAAGWAREAETDALATLAGLACADPDVRFAAALHGLLLVRSELARVAQPDPAWRETLAARWATLPPAAGAAWAASRAATERYRSATVERAAVAVYDTYLRSQGVEAGIADYGRASVLLVNALRACDAGAAAAPWCAQPGRTSGAGAASR